MTLPFWVCTASMWVALIVETILYWGFRRPSDRRYDEALGQHRKTMERLLAERRDMDRRFLDEVRAMRLPRGDA